MKLNSSTILRVPVVLLTVFSAVGPLAAQSPTSGQAAPAAAEVPFKAASSRTLPMADGGKLTIQLASAPFVMPAPPAAQPLVPRDPAAVAAWEARKRLPVKPLRLLSLSATYYGDGLTRLEWWDFSQTGKWETFEAWSHVDFRSLWLVNDFELEEARYIMCPVVLDATRFPSRRPVAFPEALRRFDPEDPGFLLTKGDINNTQALAPLIALHERYQTDGEQLHAAWEEREILQAEQEAWDKAHPAKPAEVTLKFWPIQSAEK